jgi:hypothetical protein
VGVGVGVGVGLGLGVGAGVGVTVGVVLSALAASAADERGVVPPHPEITSNNAVEMAPTRAPFLILVGCECCIEPPE